ncbi:MAG: helix-turn-helix transcriptional regulator [Bacilli bacterium]|nr:helix-turn-helix transcriptional regulator [Bacilli bacterium]
MENLDLIIAKNLLYLRKKSSLTQSEFGQKFNYSDKTVSKWELGTIVPNIETLKEIADFYGVTVDYLISEHESSEDFDSIQIRDTDKRNKAIIMALAVLAIFCIATTIYVWAYFRLKTIDVERNKYWNAFLFAVPISSLLLTFFSQKWFKKSSLPLIFSSLALWSTLLAFFILYIFENYYWFIFIIGVPIEAGFVLIYQLRHPKAVSKNKSNK